MWCHWRNLAVTYVLHYVWWRFGKDLKFSMDWYGCFIFKTHSEILFVFSITLYGTVCLLYRLLPHMPEVRVTTIYTTNHTM